MEEEQGLGSNGSDGSMGSNLLWRNSKASDRIHHQLQ